MTVVDVIQSVILFALWYRTWRTDRDLNHLAEQTTRLAGAVTKLGTAARGHLLDYIERHPRP